MRRLLAILLLLASSLPLVPPLLAATMSSNANLPACCRRHGAHHCMAQLPEGPGAEFTAVHPKCPMWPAVTTAASHAGASLIAESLSLGNPSSSASCHSISSLFVEDSLDRSRHLRGPPSLLS